MFFLGDNDLVWQTYIWGRCWNNMKQPQQKPGCMWPWHMSLNFDQLDVVQISVCGINHVATITPRDVFKWGFASPNGQCLFHSGEVLEFYILTSCFNQMMQIFHTRDHDPRQAADFVRCWWRVGSGHILHSLCVWIGRILVIVFIFEDFGAMKRWCCMSCIHFGIHVSDDMSIHTICIFDSSCSSLFSSTDARHCHHDHCCSHEMSSALLLYMIYYHHHYPKISHESMSLHYLYTATITNIGSKPSIISLSWCRHQGLHFVGLVWWLKPSFIKKEHGIHWFCWVSTGIFTFHWSFEAARKKGQARLSLRRNMGISAVDPSTFWSSFWWFALCKALCPYSL